MPETTPAAIEWTPTALGSQSLCGHWSIRAEGSGYRARHFAGLSDIPDHIGPRVPSLDSAQAWCEGELASMRRERDE